MVRLQKDQANRIVDLETQLKNALASRTEGFTAKVGLTPPLPSKSISSYRLSYLALVLPSLV